VASSLRSFRREDVPAVLELSRHALKRPDEQVGNPLWSTRDELESELADWNPPPEETLFVAEEDTAVVGFGGIELPPGFDHAELFGPLVVVRARGQKIGTRLLEASLARARAAGVRFVWGTVGTQNMSLRMLLESVGFAARGAPGAAYRLTRAEHRPLEHPPEGIDVRRGRSADFDAVYALYRECFPAGRFPESVWKSSLAGGTVYVAERGGSPVAMLNIDPGDRWIYHVGVAESERGRRIGAHLLSRSLELYWADHPNESLGLDVDADNVPAIRMYRRQGFAPWFVYQNLELALV
jgi:ribosomal protein S18 acetylase RimI-like enzyme